MRKDHLITMSVFFKIMAQLRSKDVLQIDATIIAGLLILLTVQSFSSPNFSWRSSDVQSLQIINQQITQSDVDYNSALDLIQHLRYNQQNTTQQRHDLIQSQIDDTELRLWQAQSQQKA